MLDKLVELTKTKIVLQEELKNVNTHSGYMASADVVRSYLEKRIFQLDREIKPLQKNYPEHTEEWIRKQPMRYSNGLSVSDTVIPGDYKNEYNGDQSWLKKYLW